MGQTQGRSNSGRSSRLPENADVGIEIDYFDPNEHRKESSSAKMGKIMKKLNPVSSISSSK